MIKPKNLWGILLLIEILFMVFMVGLFPEAWHNVLYKILYTFLYFTTVLCLERSRKTMLWVALLLFLLTVISGVRDIPVVEGLSKILDFIFFTVIVLFLIGQIARAKTVTKLEILEAVNGYLLLGVVFTFLIALIIQVDPLANNFSSGTVKSSDYVYYGFITFSTTGYGDLLPLKPYSKSLAILIAISGQLYLAIIIALLVGKFSASQTR